MDSPRVALAPNPDDHAVAAIERGGGLVVGLREDPDALVWLSFGQGSGLADALAAAPGVRWVQLPSAGIEDYVDSGVLGADRIWTCAKGVYSEPVAEHVLALALASLRRLPEHARATSWGDKGAASLYEAPVLVLGAGGITRALIDLLEPFRAPVTVVRRDPQRTVAGAARTVGMNALDDVLGDALLVVLALALTAETEHVIGRAQLRAMRRDAWLVNVARGRHVDTDALVGALEAGEIAGAALDVTDPEPLPDGHPLWTLPNVLITPHTANPWEASLPLLDERIVQNVGLFARGEKLVGLVDVAAGY